MLKISILGAWLMSAPLVVLPVVSVLIFGKAVAKRMADTSGFSVLEKWIARFTAIYNNLLIVLCVWIPLQPNRGLFVPGLAVYLVGIVGLVAAIAAYSKTPVDQAATSGVYRISRNPLYTANAIIFTGICCASASWMLFLLFLMLLLPQHLQILAEEKACLRKYGSAYESHLKSTPRYLIF